MFSIEKATSKDILEVEQLYIAVCRELAKGKNFPGWKEGIYPTREEAMSGYNKEELFVCRKDGCIAGTMILNSEYEMGYNQVKWNVEATGKEVLVIHTLAIHPKFNHQGLARKLVEFAKEYGKETGRKTIRIDVTDGNLPAIKLYEKLGFVYIDKIDLNRGDHGLPLFLLYEYIL